MNLLLRYNKFNISLFWLDILSAHTCIEIKLLLNTLLHQTIFYFTTHVHSMNTIPNFTTSVNLQCDRYSRCNIIYMLIVCCDNSSIECSFAIIYSVRRTTMLERIICHVTQMWHFREPSVNFIAAFKSTGWASTLFAIHSNSFIGHCPSFFSWQSRILPFPPWPFSPGTRTRVCGALTLWLCLNMPIRSLSLSWLNGGGGGCWGFQVAFIMWSGNASLRTLITMKLREQRANSKPILRERLAHLFYLLAAWWIVQHLRGHWSTAADLQKTTDSTGAVLTNRPRRCWPGLTLRNICLLFRSSGVPFSMLLREIPLCQWSPPLLPCLTMRSANCWGGGWLQRDQT